jgi:hypothetical protein
VLFKDDGVIQITYFCLNRLMEPERSSGGMVDVGGFFGESWMPISDFRAFAGILSEIPLGGSRIDGMNRLDVPGFVVEIITRGLLNDPEM